MESKSSAFVAQQQQHDAIARVAAASLGASTTSTLKNGVSSHALQRSRSFAQLRDFLSRVRELPGVASNRLFIGSLDGNLVVSASLLDAESTVPPGAEESKNKKRKRDDEERDEAASTQAADVTVHSLARRARLPPTDARLVRVRELIRQLMRLVRAVNGAKVIESYGVKLATNEAVAPGSSPPIALCCRLSAGLPIPISSIERALGSSFQDGMFTIVTPGSASEFELPHSETGAKVDSSGQKSFLVVATVNLED